MTAKFSSKRHLTDKEEAAIQKMIAADPDNPEITEEQIAQAKPFGKAFPKLMASIKRSRGRPRVEAPKLAVTLRVDPATLQKFREAAGKNWRARMVKVLNHAKVSPESERKRAHN